MPAVREHLTRRRVLVAIGILVVVIAAVVVWVTRSSAATPEPRFGMVTTGSVHRTVGASGTIAPAQEADLDFGAAGKVTSVPVKVGDTVAAGQTLATIDAASLPSQVAQAKATLASAQAKVDADSGASAAQRDADEAAVTAAQAQLDEARQSLSGATLTAPFAGTVAAVDLTVGQQIAGGASGGGSGAAAASSGSGSGGGGGTSGSGGGAGSASGGGGGASGSSAGGSGASTSSASGSSTSQIVVVSTNTFEVDASVDDTQISQVRTGQQVMITPNGATTPVAGTVSTVGLVATTTTGVATYPVTITVSGTPDGLHDGASAQVQIVVEQATNVLVAPTAAVHQENGGTVVREERDGQQVPVLVTVGLSSDGNSQISGPGVHDGMRIVVPAAPAADPAATAGSGGGGFGGGGPFGGGGGAGGDGNGRTGTGQGGGG
ncbi:efflux RND transporter periplasmic adaptor subunit [Pseudonocardia endophytica]|uniref:Multidrug efflux pump subunit AcrA (Membrane-fusion protein) n=1 Tax=Pseudonocardia endophytica TaxID=401976 RepID=A0A4R1HVS1_PSEEN|nr:HlyD family efflux transporter periplasmic adaptor subunit [Pseudonocardia endophytica]TCK26844.1 multidrug efflux pump subunit AcrA (membrane-fusion protein) [Pseudonocardia endophytica]